MLRSPLLSTSAPRLSNLNIEFWPRQRQAFETRATELLFGGASEGGKSMFIRLALIVWCAAIPGLQVRIIRKYFRDVVKNHMNGPTGFKTLLRPWIDAKLVRCTEREVRFWNGAIISLGSLLYEKDFEKEQGQEKHVLVVDEATQIKGRYIDGLRGWVRMPKEMKDLLPEQLKDLYPKLSAAERREMFPRIIYTANPIGESVGYFRRQFVQARETFKIEKVGAFLRQYIPSLVTDNKSADPQAQAERLASLGDAVATALITGDWDSPVGDFFREYDDELHVVPDFVPPKHLFKYRSFDWGGSEPFAVYWWCVWDHREHECLTFVDGRWQLKTLWFPPGSIVAYREWYGCDEKEPAKGLNMRNDDIGAGIVSRTVETSSGLTLSDGFPFRDQGHSKSGKKWMMADDFRDAGCALTRGNSDRVFGWKQFRDRLKGKDGFPYIYFVSSCIRARDYIPAIGFNPNGNLEDAAEDGEATHSCDAIRLACAARPFIIEKKSMPDDADAFKVTLTPRAILKGLKKQQRRHARR